MIGRLTGGFLSARCEGRRACPQRGAFALAALNRTVCGRPGAIGSVNFATGAVDVVHEGKARLSR